MAEPRGSAAQSQRLTLRSAKDSGNKPLVNASGRLRSPLEPSTAKLVCIVAGDVSPVVEQ